MSEEEGVSREDQAAGAAPEAVTKTVSDTSVEEQVAAQAELPGDDAAEGQQVDAVSETLSDTSFEEPVAAEQREEAPPAA